MTLYGTSYGTFVAEQYALLHPERTAALVLDSVVPHTGIDPLAVDVFSAVRRALLAACAAVGCPRDPVQDLASVVADGYDGATLLDLVTMVSVVDPTFESLLAALHSAALGSNRRTCDETVRGYREGVPGPGRRAQPGAARQCPLLGLDLPVGDVSGAARRTGGGGQGGGGGLRPLPIWCRSTPEPPPGNGFVRQCLPW